MRESFYAAPYYNLALVLPDLMFLTLTLGVTCSTWLGKTVSGDLSDAFSARR